MWQLMRLTRTSSSPLAAPADGHVTFDILGNCSRVTEVPDDPLAPSVSDVTELVVQDEAPMRRATPVPGSPTWTRLLGSTGTAGLGRLSPAAALGSMPGLFGRDVTADEGVATVHRRAATVPIRFIDTSNGYSDGESERRIGAALVEARGSSGGCRRRHEGRPARATTPATACARRSRRAASAWSRDLPAGTPARSRESFDFDGDRPHRAAGRGARRSSGRRAGRRDRPGGRPGAGDREVPGPRRLRRPAGAQPLDAGGPQRRGRLPRRGRPAGMGILNAAVYGGGILAFPVRGTDELRLPPGPARDAAGGRGDAPGVLRLPHRARHRRAAVLAAGPPDRVDRGRHEPPRVASPGTLDHWPREPLPDARCGPRSRRWCLPPARLAGRTVEALTLIKSEHPPRSDAPRSFIRLVGRSSPANRRATTTLSVRRRSRIGHGYGRARQ